MIWSPDITCNAAGKDIPTLGVDLMDWFHRAPGGESHHGMTCDLLSPIYCKENESSPRKITHRRYRTTSLVPTWPCTERLSQLFWFFFWSERRGWMGLVGGWLVWWNWVALLRVKIPAVLVLVVEIPDVMDFFVVSIPDSMTYITQTNDTDEHGTTAYIYIHCWLAVLCNVCFSPSSAHTLSASWCFFSTTPQPWRRWQYYIYPDTTE